MTVRMRREAGDLDGVKCRKCLLPALYMDHDLQVWCAECEVWNGWFAAVFFAQPGKIPYVDPNGQQALF